MCVCAPLRCITVPFSPLCKAALEEQIEKKKREVEEAVNTERAKLEARLAELQNEADEARAQADSMVLASDKLSQENMHRFCPPWFSL
jgi:DNA anti-recombination protein RmuC